jgi:hypothetical protein
MGACVSFPIKTILNESGTFTSNQTFGPLDASDVRSILLGFDLSSVSPTGYVSVQLSGLMPDGNYYNLQGNTARIGLNLLAAVTGPIPSTLQCTVTLGGGATSATLSVWAIGQA